MKNWIVPTSYMMVTTSDLIVIIEWVPYPQNVLVLQNDPNPML